MNIIASLLPFNIIVPPKSTETHIYDVYKIITELAEHNIVFTEKAVNALCATSNEYLNELLKELSPVFGAKFRNNFGANNTLTPEEINAQLAHYYMTYGLEYNHVDMLNDKHHIAKISKHEVSKNVRVIDAKTDVEFLTLIKDIISSSIVFGETQKDLLRNTPKKIISQVLEDIDKMKVKENMMFLISVNNNAKKFLKTATDLLRYIYYLNGLNYQDIKSEKDVFIKLKTSQKRFIMEFLNSLVFTFALEDFKRYKSQWIRVSNNLKPMSSKYDKFFIAQELFRVLKNEKIRTFFSFYDTLSVVQKAELLSQVPGEFIRRLDSLIRENKNIFEIKEIIEHTEFNPKLLMQIIPYLKYRADHDIKNRVFNVKGVPYHSNKSLKKLDIYNASIIIGALSEKLIRHLSTKTPFSNFVLSDEIKKYIVPTEIRDLSISNGIRYTPGTRVKFECNFLRAFTAWGTKEEDGKFDIDLGGAFVKIFDANTRKRLHNTQNDYTIIEDDHAIVPISYYNQDENFASHSGDFTSCKKFEPNDTSKKTITAEFIDIDMKKAKSQFKYALFSSFIYSSGDYKNDFDTDIYSYTGIMERDTRSTDSININDSLFKMTLKGNFQTHVSFAIDLETSEIVFIDRYSKSKSGSNIDNSYNQIDLYRREYFDAHKYKMNMYELLSYVNNPDLKEGETPIVIDNQFISDNLETIVNLLN